MGPGPARRRTWADLAAFAALLAVLAWYWRTRIVRPVPAVTFASTDLFTYFVPIHSAVADALHSARLPVWNPYQSCGEPLLAVLQGGALYPARLLLLFMSASTALGWSTFLHLALAA